MLVSVIFCPHGWNIRQKLHYVHIAPILPHFTQGHWEFQGMRHLKNSCGNFREF